jgi:2-C-methyl-D-erythritol 2,4-cyclodiphosphate synthase
MQFRNGIGYDVHRLKEGIPLMLGGIHIPHHLGSAGHSDGDVLIHAICDALFGAAALGDIGRHFPDSSDEFKDIDSKILLARCVELISKEGYKVGNIDSTVCLQKPRISEHIPEMIETLAPILGTESGQLSIKATTTEGLGFVGDESGISAYAVVLLEKS